MIHSTNYLYRAVGYKADRDWGTWCKDFGNIRAWEEWCEAVKNLFSSCLFPQKSTSLTVGETRDVRQIDDKDRIVCFLEDKDEWAAGKYCSERTGSKDRIYKERVSALANYYSKHSVRKVKADHNCFYNSASAILLQKVNVDRGFRDNVIRLLQTSSSSDVPYIREAYEKVGFSKEVDFQTVISKLENWISQDACLDDLEFMSAFSRVLRYVTQIEDFLEGNISEEASSWQNYRDVDSASLDQFNKTFGLNCEVVVVSDGSRKISPEYDVDVDDPNKVWIIKGTFDQGRVDVTGIRLSEKVSGVFLRTHNHFIAML